MASAEINQSDIGLRVSGTGAKDRCEWPVPKSTNQAWGLGMPCTGGMNGCLGLGAWLRGRSGGVPPLGVAGVVR